MGTPQNELDKIIKTGGAVSRTLDSAGRIIQQVPALASNTGLNVAAQIPRVLSNLTAEELGKGVGKTVAGASDIISGGPGRRVIGDALEAARPALVGFSAGLTGREPGQAVAQPVPAAVSGLLNQPATASSVVAPPTSGAVSPSAALQPRTVGGVGRGAAQDNAQGFLDTTASNRQALINAGGIDVIRGLSTSIDTPLQSRFGFTSTPTSQLAPGGFEGARKTLAAGGSPAVAAADISGKASVESAQIGAASRLGVQSLKNALATDAKLPGATLSEEIQRNVNLLAGGALTEEQAQTLTKRNTDLNRLLLLNQSAK